MCLADLSSLKEDMGMNHHHSPGENFALSKIESSKALIVVLRLLQRISYWSSCPDQDPKYLRNLVEYRK